MGKKKTPRRQKQRGTHENISILTLSVFSFIAGIGVFTLTSLILSSQTPCANTRSCTSDLSEHIDNNVTGIFQNRIVVPPKIDLALERLRPTTSVLGSRSDSGEKHVYIDLSTQTLYAYQDKTEVIKTLISSGKWGRTPVGNFHVWSKLRATRMSGGSGSDAYDLPNVPYVMYFYHDFGLHGAYWHNNFGYPMSHGCVNMRIVDAQALFAWIDGPTKGTLGTAVSVCDTFTAPNTCVQKNPVL